MNYLIRAKQNLKVSAVPVALTLQTSGTLVARTRRVFATNSGRRCVQPTTALSRLLFSAPAASKYWTLKRNIIKRPVLAESKSCRARRTNMESASFPGPLEVLAALVIILFFVVVVLGLFFNIPVSTTTVNKKISRTNFSFFVLGFFPFEVPCSYREKFFSYSSPTDLKSKCSSKSIEYSAFGQACCSNKKSVCEKPASPSPEKKCLAGTYYSTSKKSCTNCPKGKVSHRNGAKSCASCIKGKFGYRAGSKSCVSCPKGKSTSKIGATSKAHCKTLMSPKKN